VISKRILKEENISSVEDFFSLILADYQAEDSRADERFKMLSKSQKRDFFEFVNQTFNEVDEAKILNYFEFEEELDLEFFGED
jgi:hypothetical protein